MKPTRGFTLQSHEPISVIGLLLIKSMNPNCNRVTKAISILPDALSATPHFISHFSPWTVATPSFHSPLVSERTPAYLQMTMQDLCAELNQDDPTEIKAIMEIMLSKLMHEVLSGSDKKNVRPSSSLHHP